MQFTPKINFFFHIIFLHGLGRLTFSDIDELPSFPRASMISSSSRFVVETVFRKSGVVLSFKTVDPLCLCLDLTSCIPEIYISFLITSLLILSSIVYPLTLLSKLFSILNICTICLTKK